jgi:hypothetical protein
LPDDEEDEDELLPLALPVLVLSPEFVPVLVLVPVVVLALVLVPVLLVFSGSSLHPAAVSERPIPMAVPKVRRWAYRECFI